MTQPDDLGAVDPGTLVTHARHLDGIAWHIDTAADAATLARLDVGAYGQVCVFVPVVLGTLSNPLTESLGAITTSLRDTANRLRAAATEYTAADDRSTQRTRGHNL